MRKSIALGCSMLMLMGLLVSSSEAATSKSSKKRTWSTKLKRGVLKVRGPGYGSWGKRWITVDTRVLNYQVDSTAKGPVIVYQRKNWRWTVLQLHASTGRKINVRYFGKPMKILDTGRRWALIKVGDNCYKHAWRTHLDSASCVSETTK